MPASNFSFGYNIVSSSPICVQIEESVLAESGTFCTTQVNTTLCRCDPYTCTQVISNSDACGAFLSSDARSRVLYIVMFVGIYLYLTIVKTQNCVFDCVLIICCP